MPRIQSNAILIMGMLVTAVHAENRVPWNEQADAAYRKKDYTAAATLYEKAINEGGNVVIPAYNAACCYAQLGRIDEAFVRIDQAIAAGWRDVEQLKNDADFETLFADPRWGHVVQRCQDQFDKFIRSMSQPALREELLKRGAEDQRIRLVPNPNILEWWKIDADNAKFMKRIIERHGWPGRKMVGGDGALAAFLMVQHADTDLAFQKQCLELLRKAVEQGDASSQHLALLTDRVLVGEGKRQQYGTQFHTVNGESVPYPIEDEPNVDIRRQQVGLSPLAEYAQRMRNMDRQR